MCNSQNENNLTVHWFQGSGLLSLNKKVAKEAVSDYLFLILNAAGPKIAKKISKIVQSNNEIMYQQRQGKLHGSDSFGLLIYIDSFSVAENIAERKLYNFKEKPINNLMKHGTVTTINSVLW